MDRADLVACPDCGFENVRGADTCENCGQALTTLDVPRPEDEVIERLINERLGEIGVPPPPIVAPSDPIGYAIHMMQDRDTGAVVVCEGDRIVGILTERDILMKASDERTDLNAVKVADIMTPDPVVLREDDSLAVALHKMAIGGFRHIPLVKDGGRPTGIVSARQVFRHVSRVFD